MVVSRMVAWAAKKISQLLPMRLTVKNGLEIEIDFFKTEAEIVAGNELMNTEIRGGQSWPFDEELDKAGFANYFLSHAAFRVVALNAADVSGSGGDKLTTPVILGAFYVKPNFPGRCNHFCNGGFITHTDARGLGIGTEMGRAFLRLAHALSYRAAYFNLVFSTNVVSHHLWKKLGFTALATIPGVGKLKGHDGYVDAVQYYFDLTSLDNENTA